MPTVTFDIAAATDDGSGYKTGGSYPPSGSYVAEDAATCWAWKGATSNEVDVSYVRWDTSSLSGATISAASVRIYVTQINDTDARNLVCDYYDFGGEPSVDADWTATVGTGGFSYDITSLVLTEWNEISLTSPDANINKSGYTGLRFGISGGAATGANDVGIASYEYDPALAPELVVTYTTPGGGQSYMMMKGA